MARLNSLAISLLLSVMLAAFTVQAADRKTAPQKKAAEEKVEVAPEDGATANLNYIKARERVLDGKYEEALPLLEEAIKSDADNATLNHQLAEVLLRLSQFEKAEGYAKLAVTREPKNNEFRATFGGILASQKKYPEAKEQYAAIIENDPDNIKAPLLLGIVEAESGQAEAGVAVLTKAYEKNNDNYMALFYRAKINLEAENAESAKVDLDKCLTLHPSFVEAGTALGLLHEKLGESDLAIRAYSRIQGSGRYKKRLAQLYLQKNEYEKALNELSEYEKVEPDDYTARVKVGLIHFELKQYDLAISRFQEILKEQPSADNVRFYLGAVYEEAKQYGLALDQLKKVTKESSFYKEASIHLGFIYREKGNFKEGIELGRKLVKVNPEVVEFWDLYASFYESLKEYKKALVVLNDGLKKHVNDEKLLYFQGAIYEKLNERPKAIENMKKILSKNENSAHALNFLGYTYTEQGEKLDEAEMMIRKAVTLRPNDGFIQDSLGWVLFRRGKIDEAQVQLEKALVIQPDEPVILDHLGDLYSAKADYVKAANFYKMAVAFAKKDKDLLKKVTTKLATMEKRVRVPTNTDEAKTAVKP